MVSLLPENFILKLVAGAVGKAIELKYKCDSLKNNKPCLIYSQYFLSVNKESTKIRIKKKKKRKSTIASSFSISPARITRGLEWKNLS